MLKKSQAGQILLIVVLTMIVALTVGLSIAAGVVTELKLSKQNEESQRAFQAAEAGIQQTLENKTSINVPTQLDNNSTFATSYVTSSGAAILLNNGLEVDQANGSDVWLSDYSPDTSQQFLNVVGGGNPVPMTLYWGSAAQTSCSSAGGATVAPAIEVVLLKGPKNSPTIQRNVFETSDCWTTNRLGAANNANVIQATTGSYTVKGVQFRNSAVLTFGGSALSNGLLMRVTPIFNSSTVGFQMTGAYLFPSQGAVVTSTGTSGDTVRKVVYYQSYPQLPQEIFPYTILSQ